MKQNQENKLLKNLQIYRLYATQSADAFAEALQSQSYVPASSNEALRIGWSAPRDGDLIHVVNGQWLLMLTKEKKVLPAKAVNQIATKRAAELKEKQGFAPGKKAMKELKERVYDELLPTALSVVSHTWVWIDPVNHWLVVDTPTPSVADDVIKLLLRAIDRLPVESLRVNQSPVRAMSMWLEEDKAPAGFTIDQDATLKSTSKATVTYKRHTLEPDAMRQHLAAGKQCVKLALTWDSKISFILTESLSIKSIKALDVLTENNAIARNQDERFDGDMVLMTGELAKMLGDLVEALGGECKEQVAA